MASLMMLLQHYDWDRGELLAILFFLMLLGIVLLLGVWGVHKTSGRSYREMLLLLAAAMILIALTVPAVIFTETYLKSAGPDARRLANLAFRWGFLGIAILVWWVFNGWVKRHPSQKSQKKTSIGPGDGA
jgi:predicted MFS family arabinose efflux permease